MRIYDTCTNIIFRKKYFTDLNLSIFKFFQYLKVPKNPEKLAEYEVLEESVRSNLHYNKVYVLFELINI